MWVSKDCISCIKANGRFVLPREKLWQALRHLRQPDSTGILWIDALCINQNESLERNHQVSQMGKIYAKSTDVVAWLGLSDASSRLAMGLHYQVQPRYPED